MSPPPSPRQVLLGWFILGQLAFLIASNLLGFVQWFPSEGRQRPNEFINRVAPHFAEKQGNAWHWSEQAEGNLRRWTELTGQDQAWSLFAPTISKGTGFPAVLLSWEEPDVEDRFVAGGLLAFHETNGFSVCAEWNHPSSAGQPSPTTISGLGILAAQSPWETLALVEADRVVHRTALPRRELVLSENEPPDLHRYLRTSNCRVRKFEGNLYVNPKPAQDEPPEDLAFRLNSRTREFLTDYHDLAAAYLRWRLKDWEARNVGIEGPKQVILLQRYFRIHDPDEPRGWDGPYVVPIARWLPEQAVQDGMYLLQPFDFGAQCFVPTTRSR